MVWKQKKNLVSDGPSLMVRGKLYDVIIGELLLVLPIW